MRVALFDTIIESKVVSDLARALRSAGADVFETGAVWRGHFLPDTAEDIATIDASVERTLGMDPDLVIVIRQSALLPRHIEALQTTGRTRRGKTHQRDVWVWLPDDPVLFQTYRMTVHLYDLVLHCGPEPVLAFWESHGVNDGYYFPFFVDPARVVRVEDSPDNSRTPSLSFMGHLHGPVKGSRLPELERVGQTCAARITHFGKTPTGLSNTMPGEHIHHAGIIRNDEPDFGTRLASHHAALNLPQRIANYLGTPWATPEFAKMGVFDVPSRVVQHGAMGLPIITISDSPASWHFPLPTFSATDPELGRYVRALANDPDLGRKLGEQIHSRFREGFTAQRRANLILALAHSRDRRASRAFRANAYRLID